MYFKIDHMRHGGEPMAHIKCKYHSIDTDELFDIGLLYRYSCSMSSSYTGMIVRYRTAEANPLISWTFGWIQMRFVGEPMAQIN